MYSILCPILLSTVLATNITELNLQYVYTARIVSIFVSKSELPIDLEIVQPAISLAVADASVRYPHIKFEIVFKNKTSDCTANFAGVFAAEEYYLRRATAFVGPSCSLALDPVGRMASYWNLPIYTAGGIDASFAEKDSFRTLTRMAFSLGRVADWFVLILQTYEWYHIAILADESELPYQLIKRSVVKILKYKRGFFLSVKEFTNTSDLKSVLLDASREARIFLLITGGKKLRDILLKAYDLGMGNGEYAFFSYELIKNRRIGGDFSWYRRGDRRNKDARKIFEALMIVAVRVPISVEYRSFVAKITKMASSKISLDVNTDETVEEMVNPIIAAFYDCIIMYAWSLNQTLAEGGDPLDGYNLTRKLWNATFEKGLTGDIYINENGDREADYTLNDLDPDTGIMTPVATYFGARRKYDILRGTKIHWPGNAFGPPSDVPDCGFRGDADHCKPESESFPVWIVVFLICCVIVFVVAGMLFYRKIRLENQLADHWWKVHWEDVVFPENLTRKSTASLRTSSNVDETSSCSTKPSTTCSLFQEMALSGMKVGLYKGMKVAVKSLDIKRIVVGRTILLELKRMRDITHENLVRFVGLCTEEPNISLFTELCTRGSLMDTLANDSINMDWLFKYAMMTDIVEGMTFLHNSEFQYHGNLKSANCFIDGRFTVKLSDYGTPNLRTQIELAQDSNPRMHFWTAPEHLREKHNKGSKKGDVYSFAIILHEIVTRLGPFEFGDNSRKSKRLLEPEEILDRLKRGLDPPFRPDTDSSDCSPDLIRLIKRCWKEEPAERPNFNEIKSSLKKITKGVSSQNFLDNLLSRMEQYSNNLEQLVEEKTQSLIDEKKKTDELLYQLIPKYIAEELKKGHHVKPESYESVTIFFSDIVGFTSLSAESNPMQVVDLLNDLYTCFDAILEMYNVYKVETIGDAYMVASGCPVRIGDEHAREIARMSLTLRKALDSFKIRHRPDRKLKLRIGAHSGPCVAGVVGLKMPRYCLFGDTVNTASRMESTGEPLKIHISQQTKKILDTFGTFIISKRGDIEIKGKGVMTTYWLEAEHQ